MKYYSETLKKVYDSVEDWEAAELEQKKKDDEKAKELALAETKRKELASARKARAKEIDDAYEAVLKAEKEYRKLVSNFVNDYGSYHKSYFKTESLDDIFDSFFRLF